MRRSDVPHVWARAQMCIDASLLRVASPCHGGDRAAHQRKWDGVRRGPDAVWLNLRRLRHAWTLCRMMPAAPCFALLCAHKARPAIDKAMQLQSNAPQSDCKAKQSFASAKQGFALLCFDLGN